MQNKGFHWRGWLIFAVAVCVPAWIVYDSNNKVFPEMWEVMTALLVVTVGASALTHDMADEPDTTLRQFGLVFMVVLGFVLYVNVVNHVSYGRELLASQKSVSERDTERQKQNDDAEREKNRQVELAKAQESLLKAERNLVVQLPVNQRRAVQHRPITPTVTPAGSATPPNQTPTQQAAGPSLTPAQVRDKWNPRLLRMLVLETGLAIVGLLVLFAVRHWDGDGNGVPDWLERIAKQMTKLEFAQTYPKPFSKYGPILYPNA